jgi:hypothetical protein
MLATWPISLSSAGKLRAERWALYPTLSVIDTTAKQPSVTLSIAATTTRPPSNKDPKEPPMLDAVWDNRTSTRATRFATTVAGDCYKKLYKVNNPDRASMKSAAPARSRSSTARRIDGLNRPSPQLRSDAGINSEAVNNTRQQPTAPGRARPVMRRITPPGVTRC